MDKQQFTIDDEDNKKLDNYVQHWQEWPKSELGTPEERIEDLEDFLPSLEDFTHSHEELLYDFYAKIDTINEEIRQLKNGRE